MSRDQFNFCYSFRVRYSEVDAQGIVFNAHYLTYFDCGMTEYLRHIKYDYIYEVKKRKEDFHTIKTLVEYKKPIYFDRLIDCWVRVKRIGNSSLTFFMELHENKKEELLSTGEIVWVNASQITNKSCKLPLHLCDSIKTHEKFL